MKKLLSLLIRAVRSPSIHFQFGNIALMMFQSFVAPFIIGVAAFGAQMLFLAPVFFAQALLEPSYQADLNSSTDGETANINLSNIALQTGVLMTIAVAATIGDFDIILLIFVAIFYALYSLIGAAAFALKDVKLAAVARYTSLAAYLVTFVSMVYLDIEGAIIAANLAGFALASTIVGGILLTQRRVSFRWDRPSFGTLAGGLSFRLPTICITGLTTIVLGYAGATAATIGEFRIFMAAISSGRFINVVPLAKLQASIQRHLAFGDTELPTLLRYYGASYLVFASVLVAAFPLAYELAFGSPSFNRITLLAASLFLVAQPLAYYIFVLRPLSPIFNTTFPALLSVVLMAMFYALFALSGSADLAISISIVALVFVYVLAARSIGPVAATHRA